VFIIHIHWNCHLCKTLHSTKSSHS
jgi:hypothetical protein